MIKSDLIQFKILRNPYYILILIAMIFAGLLFYKEIVEFINQIGVDLGHHLAK